jgi:integrase
MVRIQDSGRGFPSSRPKRPPYPHEPRFDTFPIRHVQIDWDRLIAKRELILDTINTMPAYVLKPEILGLLDAEKHPTYRLILDLMWTTGARITEVLALTPSHFIDNGCDFMVVLRSLNQRPGRPTNLQLARSPKRAVPIVDSMLQDRIQSYLYAGHFRKDERIFAMARQTVNRHIHDLVDRVGGADQYYPPYLSS